MENVPDNLDVQPAVAARGDEADAAPATGPLTPPRISPADLRPYDFRHPDCGVSQDATPIDARFVEFATRFSAALSHQLHRRIDITLAYVEPLRYDEFIASLGELTCLSVLRVDPPGAQACLDLGLPVICPMIGRLLGGRMDAPEAIPLRRLTQIEQGFALQIVEQAAVDLVESLGGADLLSIREESLESSPELVRIMPPGEIVTVARFDVRLIDIDTGREADVGGGRMSLCLPDPVIEYVRHGQTQTSSSPSRMDRQMQTESLTRNILDAAVELRALLAETKVRLSDVLTMQVGDVITTQVPVKDEVALQIQGKEGFATRFGHFAGNRAVAITRSPWPAPSPVSSAASSMDSSVDSSVDSSAASSSKSSGDSSAESSASAPPEEPHS